MTWIVLSLCFFLSSCTSGNETPSVPTPDPGASKGAPGCPELASISEACANQLYRDLAARIGEAETHLSPIPPAAGRYPPTAGFYPEPIGTPAALAAHLESLVTPALVAAWLASGTTTIGGRVAVDVEGCGGPTFRVVPGGDGWAVVADLEDVRPEDGSPIAFLRGEDGHWRIDGTALPTGVACGMAPQPM